LKILVACGGTGGHILPALSFLERLKSKRKDLDILIVVTRRKIEERIVPAGYRVAHIGVSPVNCVNIRAVVRLLTGTMQSAGIILRFRPDVVVGFGSYASFAPVLFAKMLGIKTIIHEQNVAAGAANRLLARFSDRIAVSFAASREWFKPYDKKIILTGNPKSQNMARVARGEALRFFGFSEDKFTILVMGGSQGSEKINRVFLEGLCGIRNKNNLQVIHLCGIKDLAALSQRYKETGVSFRLYEFLEPMHYAYSAADLAITRAGATTISELIFFGLPAIIIPYPFARRHQAANAGLITENKAAISIEDSALNTCLLSDIISDLCGNRGKLDAMRTAYKELQNASCQQDLSDAVLSLCG
jgi:UDP-N-acetylglucosamine--N-acetylmuramyl-(pentapeptide) pyrophosphoryl-undecaprenol N-acetylglucosamine transferase